ncbi:MAG TPA: 2-succinyl-5-enolpyruvyl-6-hydroxy-3-cyclohexene-1-carboxylic-acid synthase [Candidatus Didemnitutus sp.]|nr:2-succinyl-5-enolpyruvyl-6-hydroxy-3-cyclohexene-1-carboxylic-acid synthase [Candidatus Didemnitutus sp.]
MTSLDFRNTNSLWGSVLVETLARLGVAHAVISPGSRSTPLTIAFANHEGIEAIPVLDERSAAFFALGLARRTRRPVVLLCTSGTAGANYFPAIIEAQESGVPLLVITADRPPEMRECRSGQTIDQQKLFGGHVNFHHEVSVPVATLPMLRYLRQTVAHAWERTQWPFAGPAHLNVPFRDPLPPIADESATALRGKIAADFFAMLPAPQGVTAANLETRPPAALWSEGWRGLIVVGPTQPADAADYVEAVAHIAQVLRWPVLADALTPLRNHAAVAPMLIATYDTLLRSDKLASALKPECILCLGGWPTSKRLREWLQQLQAPTFLLADDARNHDALHGRTQFIRSSVESFARCLGHAPAGASPWLKVWRTLHERAEDRLDKALKGQRALFEGKASWMLPWLLPAGTPVFVANSMPVRDVEYFWPVNDRRHEMYFNRGANGIDGTLSTALGIAHGGRPAVLLTGDLALLHDSNGFLLASKLKGSLTVLLVNNDGGGIFEHLPVAKFDPPFEEFFATPQRVDFAKLCAAHDVKHVVVRSWAEFARLMAKLPAQGVRVLELRTDRKRDAAFRQKLFADIAAKLK